MYILVYILLYYIKHCISYYIYIILNIIFNNNLLLGRPCAYYPDRPSSLACLDECSEDVLQLQQHDRLGP